MKKHHLIILIGFLVCALLFFRELSLFPDGGLDIFFLNVGQGDTTLIITPSGKQIIVDGGPNLSALEHLGKHLPFFDRSIDLMILTHPDSDHVTSFPEILKRFDVKQILLSGAHSNNPRYQSLLHLITQNDINVIIADPSQDIDLGDGVIIDVLWPPKQMIGSDVPDSNDHSVVTRILYKDHSILLPGDISTKSEMAILASGADVSADIFKAPHHGSRTSSSTGFILAVDPDLAIISAGIDNPFGHPHPDVIDRYKFFDISIRSTSKEGTIALKLD